MHVELHVLDSVARAEGDAVARGLGQLVVGEGELQGAVLLDGEVELEAVGHVDRHADQRVELLADLHPLHADRRQVVAGVVQYALHSVVVAVGARDGGVGVEVADGVSRRVAVREGDVGEPFLEPLHLVQSVVVDSPVGQGEARERGERARRRVAAQVGGQEGRQQHRLRVGAVAGRVVLSVHRVEHHLVAVGVGVGCRQTAGHHRARIEEAGEEVVGIGEGGGEAPGGGGEVARHHAREGAFDVVGGGHILVVVLVARGVVARRVEHYLEVAQRLKVGLQREGAVRRQLVGRVEERVAREEVVGAQVLHHVVVVAQYVAQPRCPMVAAVQPHEHRLAHVARQARAGGAVVLDADVAHAGGYPQGSVAHTLQYRHQALVPQAVGHSYRVLLGQGFLLRLTRLLAWRVGGQHLLQQLRLVVERHHLRCGRCLHSGRRLEDGADRLQGWGGAGIGVIRAVAQRHA